MYTKNLELFDDDITVTLHDVELWLRHAPRFDNSTRANLVKDYITNYSVIDKIKSAKMANYSYDSTPDDKFNLSLADNIKAALKPRYHPLPIMPYYRAQKLERDQKRQALKTATNNE